MYSTGIPSLARLTTADHKVAHSGGSHGEQGWQGGMARACAARLRMISVTLAWRDLVNTSMILYLLNHL